MLLLMNVIHFHAPPVIIDDLTTGVLCDDTLLLLSKNMPPPLELEFIIYYIIRLIQFLITYNI
jgi:hypothetical protein